MRVDVIGTRGFPLIEGGVEKHCEALYPLVSREAEVVVYRRRPYVKASPSYRGITFVDLPSTTIKGFEAVVHSFLATCSSVWRKPDLVHYHNIGPALFSPLLKLRGIPMVLTYHSPNYEHAKWGRFAKRLLLHSEKVALKNARRIIFVNKFQMERYPQEVLDKSVFIPNGITKPSLSEGREFLEAHGLEPGKYVLSVGRITPEKGFDTLIKAFSRACADGLEGFKLVIVGGVETEGGYKSELDGLSEGLPVVFTGQIHGEALTQAYQNAALYVLASRNEGFPLTLLEAMSFGLDVLVSDIPATHLVDFEAEDYCAVDDVDAFACALDRKLAAPKKRAYALETFDWDEVADWTLRVYEAVTSGE